MTILNQKRMLHKRFIFRQLTSSKKQSAVFMLCVILSIITIVALNGFSKSISQSLIKDAKTLHSADIIIHSHFPHSIPLINAVSDLKKQKKINIAKVYEFYSVVRAVNKKASILSSLKVVEPGYPFYGKVELGSGKNFDDVLTSGNIVVEQNLLDRLNLEIGDQLHVGSTILNIKDVVIKEPDRPVSFLSFGPRVFICAADLNSLKLLEKGSRVKYNLLLKVHELQNIEIIARQLRNIAIEDQERVDTFQTARSRIKRFFDNFLFFLALIAIFTLLLAGFGIHSSLTAFLREKEQTIAIIKTIGGTGWFINLNFMTVIFIFGLTGTVLGMLFGFLLQYFLPLMFGSLLPEDMKLIISWKAVFEGIILGLLVVSIFTFLPVYRLKNIKPASVFRKENIKSKNSWPFYLAVLIVLLFFIGMILWQLKDIKIGLYFIAGIMVLIFIAALLTNFILFILKRINPDFLVLRQAIKGLFRPGNAIRSVIITLSTSLAVIFSIYLIQENLDSAFVRSFPPDAPNLFFIDIQPDQVDEFSKLLNMKPDFYPVIRSRLISINGEKIDRKKERRRRRDNLARHFNLTYRNYLLDDEVIIKGKTLFQDDLDSLQVSVLDTVVKMKHMELGDNIKFKIQGIPVEAVVSSIRSRTKESIKPYFYFVFPSNSMIRNAPQTIFSAVRINKNLISEVQNKIVSRFPNISVINVTATIAAFSKIMHRLSLIIRFFTIFSIIAGILMIISSVFATRFARIQEAVYFKILGAKSRFIMTIFALENIIIGLISSLIALAISETGTWIICVRIFDISYKPFLAPSFLMIFLAVAMVIIVGLLASLSILKQKPVSFLREQSEI